jgi:hypothetical protein
VLDRFGKLRDLLWLYRKRLTNTADGAERRHLPAVLNLLRLPASQVTGPWSQDYRP